MLKRHINDPAALRQFTDDILAHPDAVRLSAETPGPVTRYTTKTVLETEQDILRSAGQLAHMQQHPVSAPVRAFVLKRSAFMTITEEQARAVRHATGPEGLALIDGQAGTGKTYVMRAVRDIYQKHGYRVIGLAPTNAVARILREDGFTVARTLHSELWALDHGRAQWDSRTVVMVDEAAMIDSRNLSRLTAYAQASGAKLILTGDDRQLPSIEAGGMFGVLKKRFGAAQLTEVYRQRKDDDREASQLMATGNFADALASYERNHAIHWTATQEEALSALLRQWAEDSAENDAQSRFVFAYTNRDVDRLNAALRQVREQRGELGAAQRFMTKHGAGLFATGDRIQFTGTDKPQGVFNGEVGTIRDIAGSRFTVALDGPGHNTVAFDAEAFKDFRLGYAGTIYKGQGRTIDQTYLYHSQHWTAAPSYVALTRHREKTALFVARDTAADIQELTRQVARVEDRRAASHFLQSESATEIPAAAAQTSPRAPDAKPSFRQAAKEATQKDPAPQPAPARRRRKRGEDTRGLFKRATKKILLPVARSIFDMADFAKYAPPGEFDETERLRFRQWNERGGMYQPYENHAFHYGQSNCLSPRF
jgi:Ti-type conjugative transfer relaxase TraA